MDIDSLLKNALSKVEQVASSFKSQNPVMHNPLVQNVGQDFSNLGSTIHNLPQTVSTGFSSALNHQFVPGGMTLHQVGQDIVKNPGSYNVLNLSVMPYLKNEVASPIGQGFQGLTKPGLMDKAGGAAKIASGVLSATPFGMGYNELSGGGAGLVRAARTGQDPTRSLLQGLTQPTDIGGSGLGIQNPLMAAGVDLAAGNPKTLLKKGPLLMRAAKDLFSGPRPTLDEQVAKAVPQLLDKIHNGNFTIEDQYQADNLIKHNSTVPQSVLKKIPLQKRTEFQLNELLGQLTPNQDYMYRQLPGMNAFAGQTKKIKVKNLNPTTNVPVVGGKAANQQKISLAKGGKTTNDLSAQVEKNPTIVLPDQPVTDLKLVPQVPQTLANDTKNVINGANVKERGFVTSVKTSSKTPQPLKDLVNGTYVVRSTEQLRADAKKLIKTDPASAEKMALNPTSDVHVQIGNELINHYASTGQLTKAQQIAEGMANSGTDFGRAVQAYANYDKTTPEGALRFAQSKVNEYNKANPNAKLKLNDNQVKSLFDRAKKIQQMAEGRQRNIAANELMKEVNNLIPSSIADKAITVWKAGLLTSLRTHERNLLSNTFHQGAEIAKDIPASMADKIMGIRTGQRTLTFTGKGLGSGAKQGLQSAKDVITKGYDPEEAINKYDVRHITWGKNPIEQALKIYTGAVFRTLGAADKPFWNASFARSLYDQAGAAAANAGKAGDKGFINNLVKNATPEMKGAATADANRATFKNTNKLSEVAKSIQGAKAFGVPVGQILAPFTGVPSSVAGQLIAYSPVGLVKGALTAGKVLAKNVPDLQRQAAQEIGRGVVGSGLFGIGAYLMSKGLMTGQPSSPQESSQWALEGKQANSVLINGKWRSIGSIGPENLVLLAGAKANQEANNPNGSAGEYAGNIGKDFLGQTFLQGVQGPLDAINDPARYGQSYVGNQASSVVPNIVKDTSKAFDPYQRENNTAQDYLTNSIPGLRNQNVVKRDALGNPMAQEPTGPGAFVDLLNSKTPISNPVVNELGRLNNTGNNSTPGKLGKSQTINGVKMTLTPKQLDVLESQAGPQTTTALAQLFQTPEYQALSDEDKSKAIDSVVSSVRKQVRGNINLNAPASLTTQTPTNNPNNMQFTLVDPATGSVKKIDLSKPVVEPKLTGNTELDKKLISKYKGDLTARSNDIVALYQAGKISQDEAESQLEQLTVKASKYAKPKKIKVPTNRTPFRKVKLSSTAIPQIKLAPTAGNFSVPIQNIQFKTPFTPGGTGVPVAPKFKVKFNL